MPYVRRPFVPEVYDNRSLVPIVELIGRQGLMAAEAERRAGARSGQMISDTGQMIAGGLQQIQQEREQAPIRAEQQRRLEEQRQEALARKQAAERGQQIQTQIGGAMGQPNFDPEAILASLPPEDRVAAHQMMTGIVASKRALKAEQAKQRTEIAGRIRGFKQPDGSYSPAAALMLQLEAEDDPELAQALGQYGGDPAAVTRLLDAYASFAEPDKDPADYTINDTRFSGKTNQPLVTAPVPPQQPSNPTEASLAFAAARGDKEAQAALDLLKANKGAEGGAEKPSVWISKGADMRFVTPSQAASMSADGWRSGQSREQGRPVTSGDAGRIADLDTSLSDLKVLSGATSGSTGTSAKVGAMLPNWVTEWTGRGASAKSKQAVIDRVKQVIGKALEGGVLRKEDELKYEKILPTIGDVPSVVKSKLEGLQQAITQRRQTALEALADAGYDTSRFEQRTPTTAPNYIPIDPNQVVPVAPRRPGGR